MEGALCNGGLYIKLGQGLGSFNHVLPAEYIKTLAVLQDMVCLCVADVCAGVIIVGACSQFNRNLSLSTVQISLCGF